MIKRHCARTKPGRIISAYCIVSKYFYHMSTYQDLERRSKEELIQLILQQKRADNRAQPSKKKQKREGKHKPFDFARYGTQRIALKFAYLGWDLHGLAQQPDRMNTVEEHLFSALRTAKLVPENENGSTLGLPESAKYERCGRTDVGVSAFSQVVSLTIRSLKPLPPPPPPSNPDSSTTASNINEGSNSNCDSNKKPKKIREVVEDHPLLYATKINSLLPPTIRVYGAAFIDQEFSARIHAFDIELITPATQEFQSVYAFVITGSAFLWHQIRCIVSVLFLVGKQLEQPSIVTHLLDINTCPAKPFYDMAADLPLVLWDCSYDNLDFVYLSDVVKQVRDSFSTIWKEATLKSAITQQMIEKLTKHFPITNKVGNILSNFEEYEQLEGSNSAQKQPYKPLMQRSTAPTLAQTQNKLTGKKRQTYQDKLDRQQQFSQQDAKKTKKTEKE